MTVLNVNTMKIFLQLVIIHLIVFPGQASVDESTECSLPRSRKLSAMCIQGGSRLLSCYKPLPNSSTVLFKCREPMYIKVIDPGFKHFKCVKGELQPSFTDNFCQPICGRAFDEITDPARSESKSKIFPWNVVIYENRQDKWSMTCAGSLVSNTVTLTAAHCFRYEVPGLRGLQDVDVKNMQIGLGKRYSDVEDQRDNHVQLLGIDRVVTHSSYEGFKNNYENDIALAVFDDPIIPTVNVHPVCLDIRSDNNDDELFKEKHGEVTGWKEVPPSQVIQTSGINFVAREDCLNGADPGFVPFVTKDKICAKGQSGGTAGLCIGGSGGGLVFYDDVSKSYFLRGILSVGHKDCGEHGFSLFTKIAHHADFIESVLKTQKS